MLPTRWLDAGLDPRNTPSGLLRHARVASAVGAGLAAGAGGLTAAGLLVDPRLGAAAGLLLGVALLNLALLRSGLVRIRRDLEASSRHDHDRVVELAFHDALTGLPNRQHFQERLGESLYAASRHDRTAALLFLDLDGFKMVNDSLGHSAGDRLLREVAGRLRSSVRLTDAVGRHADDDDGSVSRLGGDEFTVLLTELSDPVGAATVAKRILDALQRPIDVDGCEVHVGASIGIAICPADGVDPETLLRCADQAMYEAKSRGRNNFQFYTEALSRATERKVRVEARLRHALEEGGLELHYQPLREIVSGRVARAEALLRWNDPELGPVPPSEFVPVAEQTGLVTSLGAWVIRTALLQARAWTEAGHRPIRLAANLSSRHLRHHSLVETVSAALTESGVSPELFELEITESSIMTDDPVTRDALGALSDLGVGLALDDFGTGFSSLAHLRILPFDRLKIDRSFVADLEENGDDRALVASVVQLAHSLGMRVAAEGVETEQQLAFLRERGCDEVQGYLIGAPAPAAELERFLEPEKADEA